MPQSPPLQTIAKIPALPPRADTAHKGECGRVLVIAGSRGMSGAACLAATAALRGGAGLVTAAIPEGILPIVAGYEPSYLTLAIREDDQGRIHSAAIDQLISHSENQTAAAIGPGLGQSQGLLELVGKLYTDLSIPLVVDADALNLLSRRPFLITRPEAAAHRILTPHPGEFSRLTGVGISEIQSDRQTHAVEFARKHRVILVLKGHETIITDGFQLAINTTGNSGMATGGTGDVLAGLITALLGQGMSPFDAAQLGVHVHGIAGDLAVEEVSKFGLIASDILKYLGRAWYEIEG
ncbi:MAG: NAD(P)H-hydrate dehydratase [Planctomycetes bacterium]|nr:NAD(P)H-hydrate dehydratase [Planctomycetota bacterium]